jgi:hypothetical protein
LLCFSPVAEQKRRQAIRQQYDRLTEIVPGLEGLSRSEGVVLHTTVEFIHKQLADRQRLIDGIEKAGGEVDEKHKRSVRVPRLPNPSLTLLATARN